MLPLPDAILDVSELEELISRPTPEVIAMMGRVQGDLLFLGAGGKIGPSLAVMAKRASDTAGTSRKVIAASRFSNAKVEAYLHSQGVETQRVELLDAEQLAALPEVENVFYMAGFKFGAFDNPSLAWAMNSFLPGQVMQRYARSRVVAFSTGCVYGLSAVHAAGAVETDPVNPTDEYSMSCLGRERIIEYFCRAQDTPTSILRLNYAIDMRYGVLVDLAQMVYRQQPIDLTMGHCNVIWQGDANAISLRALEQVRNPALVVNVVGPEMLSTRRLAEQFGKLMDRPVQFVGQESSSCLLTSGGLCQELFGYPQIPVGRMMEWIAGWILNEQPTYGKPTGYQVRDGRY